MNVFISEMCKTMGLADVRKLNCSCSVGTIIDDSKVSFNMTLPGGIRIEVYTPNQDSLPNEEGYAYIPEYECESPDMCAEDLGVWVDDALNCCRRIDAYYESIRGRESTLNSALTPEMSTRIKDVFRAAQSAVDLPPGFRYTTFRENKAADLILSTLMYTSPKLGSTQWVAKSSLGLDADEGAVTDEWNFEPNYNPDSEGHLIYHRAGRFIDVERGVYAYTAEGDTPEARDKRAAYWLAGLLSDMVDSMLQNPPARCYEFFLADGIAELKKSDLDRMSTPGVMRLVSKGYVDPEKVLKAKPDLAKDLVQKGLVTPEVVARRVPERLLWLVQSGYISPDYAIKVDPSIKDKLVRKGLYSVGENIPDAPEEIIEGVKSGSITPTDAYRKNPKLLQPMVEQQLITPQEAYKLDASIVTWLLLNHFIGKEEAMKVKPDIQKYIARKYKDVNWDELDASKDSDTKSDTGRLSRLREKFKKFEQSANKTGKNVDNAIDEIMKTTGRVQRAAGLNSSISFNSNVQETLEEGEPVAALGPSAESTGYQMLSETTAEGPGYVAEVMLPEDDFDGVVVPGATEEIAKETLTQMLLANDGTFIDWRAIPCIQTFKNENPNGNFVVLN